MVRAGGEKRRCRARCLAVTSGLIGNTVAGLAVGMLTFSQPAVTQPIPPPMGPVYSNGDYPYTATFNFNPSTCSRDPEGLIYFAVGRRVLRHPFENLSILAGPTPSGRRAMPQVAHPEEPWGCPDHPLQMQAYQIWFTAPPATDRQADAPNIRALSIKLNDGADVYRQNDTFDLICSSYNMVNNSVPGFTGCRKPFKMDRSEVFLANDYKEPDGPHLAFYCSGGMLVRDRLEGCDGAYRLEPNLNVYFTFNARFLSVEDFPRADAEIRRLLLQSEVNFDWLPPVSDKGDR